jgi:hypothetical protein
LTFNGLQDAIFQKIELFLTTGVRTSNPTKQKIPVLYPDNDEALGLLVCCDSNKEFLERVFMCKTISGPYDFYPLPISVQTLSSINNFFSYENFIQYLFFILTVNAIRYRKLITGRKILITVQYNSRNWGI